MSNVHSNFKNTPLTHSKRLVEVLKPLQPKVGAEIGVAIGKTSLELLRAFPELKLYMVDQWDADYWGSSKNADGVYNSVKEKCKEFGDRAVIIRGDSISAAEKVGKEELDFVFIDADHHYEFVKPDILTYSPKVKKGGWITGHDYKHPNWPGVKKAVDEIFGSDILLVGSYIWIWRK